MQQKVQKLIADAFNNSINRPSMATTLHDNRYRDMDKTPPLQDDELSSEAKMASPIQMPIQHIVAPKKILIEKR